MSIIDGTSNFYEKLVLEELGEQAGFRLDDQDFLADAVCIALNALPSRYFRHGVDMAFYLPTDEYLQMKAKTREVVKDAIERVEAAPRKSSQ
ncbi:late competence development ComFB family protein [Methylohalobius crimeensis]|uniref:late competence development ComFB family protein n=1 Tax=Methylohalobius crimeensis TaxID=244365 RepID=UPI0003B43227|nr:late competence development ComFB family protein [Methylohalobius crimeensis]